MKLKGQSTRQELVKELVNYAYYMQLDKTFLKWDYEDIIEHLQEFINECKDCRNKFTTLEKEE